jgi:hypothetical protein
MFLALGAASSAIDALKALTSSKSSQTSGVGKNSENPFALMSSNASAAGGTGAATGTGGGNASSISPETMSALLDAQSQSSNASSSASKSRHNALKDLFGQIDGDGDGQISKSEFEQALGAGGTNLANADSVFGKLDKDGDGSVSLKELASELRPGKSRQHQDEANGAGASGSDPLSQLTQGASTSTVTNSDGSVTTSLTYADGSKVTMTSAASGSTSSAATSSYNFIEQMIQRQAQAISASTAASVSMSA